MNHYSSVPACREEGKTQPTKNSMEILCNLQSVQHVMSKRGVSYSDNFQPGHLAITTNTNELLGTGFFIMHLSLQSQTRSNSDVDNNDSM